jgi:hypothetical protein
MRRKLRGSLFPNVRVGSKADIRVRPRHVRFTPKSGHSRDTERLQGRSDSGGRLYEEIETVLFKDRLRRLRTQE